MPDGALSERLGRYPLARICDLDFLVITEDRCVDLIVEAAADGVGGWVVTPNLDLLRKCTYEPEIKQICERADVRVADGMPVVWASKIQGTPLPERVTGSNMTTSVTAACAAKAQKPKRHWPSEANTPPISGPRNADDPQTIDMTASSRGPRRAGNSCAMAT